VTRDKAKAETQHNERKGESMETQIDPFVYKVVRIYNLLSRRDRYKTYDTYLEAVNAVQKLTEQAQGTGYMYIIQSEPRRAK
jgi:hypothetical protein